MVDVGEAVAQQSVGFVEEQDGSHLGVFDNGTVLFEDVFHVLLTFAHPFAADVGHVDLVDASPRHACQLQGGFGLTRSGTAIKQAGKTSAQPVLDKSLMDAQIVFLLQQAA